MANRWGKNGNSERLFSLVPKLLQMVTAAMKFKDACSLEEKLWQRQHIKKQKHHFANKCQSYGFFNNHIWMWYLEQKEGWERNNWCLRNAVLEKTLERPLVSKEITPVNPKEINPEYSLEGLMLKLQYFGHLIRRANSLEKTLTLGKIEGRRREWQKMRWLNTIIDSVDMNLSKLWKIRRLGKPGLLHSTGSHRVGHDLATEQQEGRSHQERRLLSPGK